MFPLYRKLCKHAYFQPSVPRAHVALWRRGIYKSPIPQTVRLRKAYKRSPIKEIKKKGKRSWGKYKNKSAWNKTGATNNNNNRACDEGRSQLEAASRQFCSPPDGEIIRYAPRNHARAKRIPTNHKTTDKTCKRGLTKTHLEINKMGIAQSRLSYREKPA